MPTESSRSVRHTWLYTLGSIVFFIGFFGAFVALLMLESLGEAPGALITVIIVLQLVATGVQVRWCWFLRSGLAGGLPAPGWTAGLVAPALAVWVLALFDPATGFTGAAALWAATCLVACLVSRRVRWWVVAAGAAVLVAHAWLTAAIAGGPFAFASDAGAWPTLIYAALLPFMLISCVWWWQIVVELDRHRRTAAQLAVAQERLRFASDLHDIQGHHLQVISLKSELAERLLERDPDAARENIHEVRVIAKQALEETRSLVAGYRRVSLDDELENAREVLTASGAACALSIAALPTDAAVRSALASVVREATTNILRHSEAQAVSIALAERAGDWVLEIENDGAHPAGDAAAAGDPAPAGSGLAGLRDRLAAVGGTVVADAAGHRFSVRATVPARAAAASVDAEMTA